MTNAGKLLYAKRSALMLGVALIVAGCEEGKGPKFDFLKKRPSAEASSSADAGAAVTAGERDVEAPEVFSANEDALWDGRPSLGGVWVAYPGIKDPERVIIRNESNGKFVIGALFRRERDNPGPKLQMSSDAAGELGMLAGQPVKVSVVALRKEAIVVEPDVPLPAPGDAIDATLPPATDIEASTLDPVEAASAAIDRAADPAPAAAAPAPAPKPAAPKPQQTSSLSKPFIQIGIFSVKSNADNTATSLRGVGVLPIVKEQTSQGKKFYRVLVGPAGTSGERATLLKKVKGLGFNDAYFVTN
ncbi:SPOR domain-containing protein [uncultured Litoreibacter sp.]|uniref:SPOR domain-containing protein n=1 Tax=uncultured Litoreibacter sp. TaxID=1392394 RepID=UPI002606D9A9|nr:SPOR domain-containing protein [uncultured Litoreibacter sp.]